MGLTNPIDCDKEKKKIVKKNNKNQKSKSEKAKDEQDNSSSFNLVSITGSSDPGQAMMGCSPSHLMATFSSSSNSSADKKPEFLIESIECHSGGVTTMAISEDFSLLVTCGDDSIAKMWSTFSNPMEQIGELVGHKGYLTCCAISDLFIYTASADGTIRKWDISTCECLYIYEGHQSRVNKILVVGHYLFSSSYDRTARCWYADLAAPVVFSHEFQINPLESTDLDDDHEDDAENIEPIDIQKIKKSIKIEDCVRVFEGHTKGIYPLVFLPDPNNLLTDRRIYDLDIVITGSADHTVKTWSMKTGECLKTLEHENCVNCMAIDPFNPRRIFTAGSDPVIKCWDIVTGDLIRELKGHEGPILCLLPFNRMLYSGSGDRTARSWIMEFGDQTRVYHRATAGVCCMRYSDGMLYAGSCDSVARVYDSKSGTLKRVFKAHTSAITSLEVAPGKLFTGSYDGKLCVWDTRGVTEDTVFGQKFAQDMENQDEPDSENVIKAIRAIDPYIRQF